MTSKTAPTQDDERIKRIGEPKVDELIELSDNDLEKKPVRAWLRDDQLSDANEVLEVVEDHPTTVEVRKSHLVNVSHEHTHNPNTWDYNLTVIFEPGCEVGDIVTELSQMGYKITDMSVPRTDGRWEDYDLNPTGEIRVLLPNY